MILNYKIVCGIVPRSAILNLGYQVSLSHVMPNSIKTNCPNNILWDIFRLWKLKNPGPPLIPGPGYNIMQKEVETKNISFDLHPDATPVSKENNLVRYQINPTKNWGPGCRGSAAFGGQLKTEEIRKANQGKRSHPKKEELNPNKTEEAESSPSPDVKTFKPDTEGATTN